MIDNTHELDNVAEHIAERVFLYSGCPLLSVVSVEQIGIDNEKVEYLTKQLNLVGINVRSKLIGSSRFFVYEYDATKLLHAIDSELTLYRSKLNSVEICGYHTCRFCALVDTIRKYVDCLSDRYASVCFRVDDNIYGKYTKQFLTQIVNRLSTFDFPIDGSSETRKYRAGFNETGDGKLSVYVSDARRF